MKSTPVVKTLQDISHNTSVTPKESDVEHYRALLRTKPASFWEKAGAKKALTLFHAAATQVPAYKKFLKAHKVDPAHIKTIADFSKVPPTTKENYIKKYSLAERSWGGKLDGHSIVAVSSGTSGEPTLWPRGGNQEFEAVLTHELLYTELFEIDRYRTLMIIGFPMGMYVSGVATSIPSFLAATKHPKLTIATVGNNKEAVLKLVHSMHKEYEQIVLVSHPFFAKDVIETGAHEGISWRKTKIKTLFCSEGYNETWRDFLASQIGSDPASTLFNTYGSSEFLLVGYENPYTTTIRQHAEKDAELSDTLFGTTVVPSLFQYNPLMRYIQTEGNDLVITANSGVPLIRFNQHDAGEVIPFEQMEETMGAHKKPLKNSHKNAFKPWQLPFVTLHGRSDRTLVFHAANIYPENIQVALNKKEYLSKLTGKFVMEKKYLKKMDQYLEIHIELEPGVKATPTLSQSLQKDITATLEKVNMEYRDARQRSHKDLTPRIDLRPYQDVTYFKPGLKPRYIAQ